MIDLHSHILPGIDDGARNFDESVAMVKRMAEAGVTDVFATSHYIHETAHSSPKSKNQLLLDELKAHLAREGVKINVHLGHEIYIDEEILPLIREGKIATMGGSEYLLVELPLSGEFTGYQDILAELIADGYKVILAHPERYASVQKDINVAVELYQMGVLLQCNLGSLFDKYGKKAHKTLAELARRKMIFGFGTDAHRVLREDFLKIAKKKLAKYYTKNELEQVLNSLLLSESVV